MRCISVTLTLALALAAAYQIEATSLSASSNSAISSTADTLTGKLISYYDPANVGLLPAPYFWWEAGGMWESCLITGTILEMPNTIITWLKQ
jgi:mannan endo-1,6-alpha-mannosidase